jgi:hypothetical protein
MRTPYFVTTTINAPTEALRKIANAAGWKTVAIGDKKTPAPWKENGVTYLGPEEQERLSYATIPLLPWNTTARAMIGFLEAMREGADSITQIDDDNIIYDNFALPAFDTTYKELGGVPFVNIYREFTDSPLWPRGYPLNRIREAHTPTKHDRDSHVGVWQHLADNDTDVDAIYRLTSDEPVTFRREEPMTIAPNTVCPFNCQSTTFRKETFPLLYLPAFVHPRVSDIVRGFVAQPILWANGFVLGFTPALVRQERNPHDYLKDFGAELPIYLHAEEICYIAAKATRMGRSMPEQLTDVYTALVSKGLVPSEELDLLAAWNMDVSALLSL